MGTEIERKFQVIGDEWRGTDEGQLLRQGYIETSAAVSVRVRTAGDKAWLTLKAGLGLVRNEYEYEIPLQDGLELLDDHCRPGQITKRRHSITFEGRVWVVDQFLDDLAGLVLAEVELDEPTEPVTIPDWAGPEVTGMRAYSNEHLSRRPLSEDER